jgi:hypothetical protein
MSVETTTETAPATTLAQTAATGESLATTSNAATNAASHVASAAAVAAAAASVEKSLSKMTAEEHKAAIAAQIESKKTTTGKSKPAPAETPAGEPAAATSEAPAETSPETTETPVAAEPIKPQVEADPAAERLLKLALDGQRLSQERKAFREEKARTRAEAEAVRAQAAAAQERLAKLEQARAGGREVDVLRAAGLTDEQIRGPFMVNLLEQLRQEEEKGGAAAAPAGLSKEQILELVAAQQKEQAQQAQQAQQQQLQASIERDRNAFFGQVAAEFKTDLYPLVAAVRPTHAELDAHFVQHYQTTGERLTAPQLLAAFEARYKQQGLAVVPKPKPGQKPAPKPVAATSKTINGRAQSDAGETVVPQVDRPLTPYEIREAGKAKALAALAAKHAARGH